MLEIPILIACGLVVGLALGLTGGGGSNFAVPLLVYVVGVPPSQAMPLSLAAVAIVAAIGAAHAIRQSLIFWPPTLVFAAGGMLGAPLGLRLAHGFSENSLQLGFACLALMVGCSMVWRAYRHPAEASVVRARLEGDGSGPVCRLSDDGSLRFSAPCSAILAVAGLCAGLLAGFFGVGGGFIIVPALMFITRMGIHGAVATSLVVIAMTGLTGTAYALLHGKLAWLLLVPFAAGGAIGMLLGRTLAGRLAGPQLQKGFALAIIALAAYMLTH